MGHAAPHYVKVGRFDRPASMTHEDVLKAAWVRADLSVQALEDALEAYWQHGRLPSWWAPAGPPVYRDPTQPETR